MLIGWMVLGTLTISTLDTAFWHFKRYQMPFLALFFPMAGWGLLALGNMWRQIKRRLSRFLNDPAYISTPHVEWGLNSRIEVLGIFVAVGIAYTLMTTFDFLYKYVLNVGYVYQQPLQMARWLQANTPPDAVIAVHDVGMMRYMGERTTLDMVGLTTSGAADYWRNGPGSIAEFLIEQRPDYIASYGYGHGYGLGMLADTDLYGQPLASFPVQLYPNYNVALAADFQGIYKPDWKAATNANVIHQSNLIDYLSTYKLAASLNVSNLRSERQWASVEGIFFGGNYEWQASKLLAGFPSEVHELGYGGCEEDCNVLDGGRRIDVEENIQLRFPKDRQCSNIVIVSRVNPIKRGTIDLVFDSGQTITRWIPEMPGRWIEIPTLISCSYANQELGEIRFKIFPHIDEGNAYTPYFHWVYYAETQPEAFTGTPLTAFQDGAIELAAAQVDYEPGEAQMPIDIDWYTDGSAQGDYKVFVHILDEDDQIIAQADTYPGHGSLPPGNWLPGILHDTIVVDLGQMPPGKYRVAIGLYNPYTGERLQPSGGDDQNRFFIGDVEIK
jgi:hypothetical protein